MKAVFAVALFGAVLAFASAAPYQLIEFEPVEYVRVARSPQFGFGPQFGGSASSANAASQSFNQGGGFPGFGGFGGSASSANAASQSFNQGGGFPGFGGSASSANAASQSFNQGGGFGGGFGGSAASAGAQSQSFQG